MFARVSLLRLPHQKPWNKLAAANIRHPLE